MTTTATPTTTTCSTCDEVITADGPDRWAATTDGTWFCQIKGQAIAHAPHPHYAGTHDWASPEAVPPTPTVEAHGPALSVRMHLLQSGAWHAAWSLRMDELAANPLPTCTFCGGPTAEGTDRHSLCEVRNGRSILTRLDSTPTCPCSPCTNAAGLAR